MTAKRAAIYVRVSVAVEDGVSLDVQREDCLNFAKAHRWHVVGEPYADEGISAFKNVVRPAYERLLRDVQAGLIDVVLVYKLDRFARSSKELVRYLEIFKQHGVVIASVHDSIDTSTASGEAMLKIATAIAELESENTSRRRRDASAARAKLGQVTKGGRRPFGYEDDRVTVRESEAVYIREAADRFLAGESLRSIAIDFNGRGIRTSAADKPKRNAPGEVSPGLWGSSTLGQCLRSPRLAGYRVHKGEAHKSDVIGAVLTEDQHLRLVEALSDSRRRAPRKTVARFLLSSLLRCGVCGGPMKIRGGDRGGPRYACFKRPETTYCGSVTIHAAKTEAQVFEDVVSMLDSGRLQEVGADVDVSTLLADAERALREDQAHLDQLSRDHYVGTDGFRLSRDEYVAARLPLTERISEAEATIAALRRRASASAPLVPGTPDELRAWWSHARLEDRRALLDAVLHKVTVWPAKRGANTYDPDRLTYDWRA